MILACTGHRPDKLWGYNLNIPQYQKLAKTMIDIMKDVGATHLINGMALGTDTVFAFASLKYRDDNLDRKVIVECAIPCRNHTSKFKPEDRERYLRILDSADIINKVSNEPYNPYLMQKRNEYMVDKCDKLLAIFNFTNGGTYNCINYAKKVGKEIIYINPKEV
jgi:uncharacterized phage-like protein YoqJ